MRSWGSEGRWKRRWTRCWIEGRERGASVRAPSAPSPQLSLGGFWPSPLSTTPPTIHIQGGTHSHDPPAAHPRSSHCPNHLVGWRPGFDLDFCVFFSRQIWPQSTCRSLEPGPPAQLVFRLPVWWNLIHNVRL